MKIRSFWVVIPAVVFTFGACGKKAEPVKPGEASTPSAVSSGESTPAAPAAPGAPAAPVTPAVPVASAAAGTPAAPAAPATPVALEFKALSPDERAAKLGFVRYLPQDTESVIAIYNGNKIADRTKEMKFWKVIEEGIGGVFGMRMGQPMPPEEGFGRDAAPMDEDFAIPEGEQEKAAPAAEKPRDAATAAAAEPDDAADDAADDAPVMEPAGEGMPDSPAPGDLLGLEVTVAVGKSAGEQLTNLATLSNRLSYFQVRGLTRALVAAAKAGELSGIESAMNDQFGEELAKNMINDPESGIGLLERSKMPPLYVAFRTDKAKQESVALAVTSFLGNMGGAGEVVEAVDFENAGAKFSGFKLVGTKVAEQMASEREQMEAMLGAESVDKLLAAIAKKDLVVASGTLGEYVVVFIGTSEKDCGLVNELSQSLIGGPALAFADAYAAKDLAALVFGNDSIAKAISSAQGGLATYTGGLRDGLAGEDGLGDTRDLEALLQMVADREAALRKLGGMAATGTVAFFEDGLKVESFGGYDPGAVDWKTPAKLGHLGEAPDVAFFANMTSDAAYDEKARAYFEALVETAYATAMRISELPMEEEQMKEFKAMATMFNEKFRGDAVALWDALKGDLAAGLGQETAIIVDLKGTVPAIPGIPQLLVDKGRFPRATVLAPVTDRTKLASSWTKMNEVCTRLLAKVSEVAGKEIPMQRPMSSEKDGYTTWYLSYAFLNDDFVPSVTVGDKWFAASTSKNRALDLLGNADKGTAPGRTGLWLKMDFKAMRECAAETLKLLDENAVAVFGEDSPQLEQFKASKDMRDKLLDAMGELDSLTVHSRREGTALRGSIHFKTR
ncbi:MAG: hypothetical protein NTW21_06970 [Verrucomicrobia bacterium]|nr:hypothetical protein [Verrucomicrobiota bacterium]